MHVAAATAPGGRAENEDWLAVTTRLAVVIDGATARVASGCSHGPAWYARSLGAAVAAGAADPDRTLTEVLAAAIAEVAALHPRCDLSRPGAPSAAVGVVRHEGAVVRWLVLGDVTLVVDTAAGLEVICDDRVGRVAVAERAEADRYPLGAPEKDAALVAMKQAELAAQNRDGGYWIAAADPVAVEHALTGAVDTATVRRFALLSDGAARLVTDFGHATWSDVLDLLATAGPAELIDRVRAVEDGDPAGRKHRRTKKSDDATIIYASAAR